MPPPGRVRLDRLRYRRPCPLYLRLVCQLVAAGESSPNTPERVFLSRTDARGVLHHTRRGSLFLLQRYFVRLAEAGTIPAVGTIGES